MGGPRVKRRVLRITLALDLASLAIAIVLASLLVFDVVIVWRNPAVPGSLSRLIASLFLGAWLGSEVSQRIWQMSIPRPSYVRAVLIVVVATAFVSLTIVAIRPYWSRSFLLLVMLIWLLLMLLHRAVRRLRPVVERLVIVSSVATLIEDLEEAVTADVIDVIDPRTQDEIELPPPGVSVAVDYRAAQSNRVARFVSSCTLAGIDVRPLAQVYEEHTGKFVIIHLAEGWEMVPALNRWAWYRGPKRALDTLLILVLSPILIVLALLAALAVKLSSPGPVLFRQERVGLRGVPFTLLKFRTMKADAEARGPQFASEDDERITRTGSIMRRLRIDEIPQLWNVLLGQLSIVGPRPEQVQFAQQFSEEIPFYDERHLVRPGITGWAQVNFGYASSIEETVEKLRYDLFYVKHVGPWLDLRILGATVWTVLSGDGAK